MLKVTEFKKKSVECACLLNVMLGKEQEWDLKTYKKFFSGKLNKLSLDTQT
jgi:hypothetical protein